MRCNIPAAGRSVGTSWDSCFPLCRGFSGRGPRSAPDRPARQSQVSTPRLPAGGQTPMGARRSILCGDAQTEESTWHVVTEQDRQEPAG